MIQHIYIYDATFIKKKFVTWFWKKFVGFRHFGILLRKRLRFRALSNPFQDGRRSGTQILN